MKVFPRKKVAMRMLLRGEVEMRDLLRGKHYANSLTWETLSNLLTWETFTPQQTTLSRGSHSEDRRS